MTRRLTAHLFYSINGVAESPNLWQFDAFGPEEGQMMGRAISGGTDVVIGRKLWQEWSQYWPDADASDPFGQFINPVRKHVVSRTLSGTLGWNSAVIDSDPAAYVAQLKQEGSGTSFWSAASRRPEACSSPVLLTRLPSRSTPWPPRRDGGCSTSPCR